MEKSRLECAFKIQWLLAVGLFLLPDSSFAATIHYIAATGTLGDNSSCDSPGYLEASGIASAITAASTGDVLHVCPGTYDITTTLQLTKSITIEGESADTTILDGGDSVQIARIVDPVRESSGGEPRVTISKLTFQHGLARNASLDLSCYSGKCGGALYIEDEASADISDCYFFYNKAYLHGGAIANDGGTDGKGSTLTIYRTLFVRNATTQYVSGDGGAVAFGFNSSSSVSPKIVSSTFIGNYAFRDGQAIGVSFGKLNVYGSTIYQTHENFYFGYSDWDYATGQMSLIYGNVRLQGSLVVRQLPGFYPRMCRSGVVDAGGNIVPDASCQNPTASAPATILTYDSLALNTFDPMATPYVYPKIDSPVVEAVSAAFCTEQSLDGRGLARSGGEDTTCDAGAIEHISGAKSSAVQVMSAPAVSWDAFHGFGIAVAAHVESTRNIYFSTDTTDKCSINSITGAITPLASGTCHVNLFFYRSAFGDDEFTLDFIHTLVPLPNLVEAPEIVGSFEVGSLLSASSGRWENASGLFTYSWYRCPLELLTDDPSVIAATCETLGIGDSSYLVAESDSNQFITVIVTASNSMGSTAAKSDSQEIFDKPSEDVSTGETSGTPRAQETVEERFISGRVYGVGCSSLEHSGGGVIEAILVAIAALIIRRQFKAI